MAPGGTKLELMDRNLREGERVQLRLRKDVWPKESVVALMLRTESFSPRQMQELRLYVSLTGAVIIVRGASAVGRRGCYRNPMISSKYQLLEIEQSLHMESLMPQTEFYFLLLLLPPPL